MMKSAPVIWIADLDPEAHEYKGKELRQLAQLTQAKFPIVPGFIISSQAYHEFLRENKLDHKIQQLLSTIAVHRPESLMQGEHHIKQLFKEAKLSEKLFNEINEFYIELGRDEVVLSLFESEPQGKKHREAHIDTFESLIKEITNAWAEMFAAHALWHRNQFSTQHVNATADILIQKKITGHTHGTAATIDPHNHAKDKIVITVQSPHEGDSYTFSKKNLTIIDRHLTYKSHHNKLTHDELLTIAKLAKRVENHLFFPQVITWAIDGKKLYLVDCKPINSLPKIHPEPKKRLPAARGKGITSMIATGYVSIIRTSSDFQRIKQHDVVVTHDLPVKHLPKVRKARAVIIESGNPHTEIAALLRKQAIPAICQVKHATKQFKNGYLITVHGSKGEIYKGGFL